MSNNYNQAVVYKEILFDSRTEATWSAYFDCVGLEWQREPETFRINSDDREQLALEAIRLDDMAIVHDPLLYTPDFFIPKLDTYVEIKYNRIYPIDILKVIAVARCLGKSALLINGGPHDLFTIYSYGSNSSYKDVVSLSDNRLGSMYKFSPGDLITESSAGEIIREARRVSSGERANFVVASDQAKLDNHKARKDKQSKARTI